MCWSPIYHSLFSLCRISAYVEVRRQIVPPIHHFSVTVMANVSTVSTPTGHDRDHARHPFLDQVLRIPIQDLITIRDVFVLECGSSIRQALAGLGARRILSAPVLNSSGAAFGFVDYLDIVSYLIRKSGGNVNEAVEHMSDRLDAVAGQSKRNPFIHLFGKTAAVVVTEIFASGVHRCAIFDEDFKISSLVSQSDLIRYIRKQLKFPQMAEFASMTASEAGWGQRQVVTVPGRISVVDVIRKIEEYNVYAVAIVGDENNLLGNFSLSDLRGLTDTDASLLMLPVDDYLRQRSPTSLNVISCTPYTSVGNIIETLADERLHRVWVVDSKLCPIGLVSLTDIMNLILNFTPKRKTHVLPVPGILQVSILGTRNMSSASWLSKPYVIVQISGIKKSPFVTPVSESVNEASWANQAFMVEVNESIVQESLVFTVKGQKFYGADEDIGYLTVAFEWVLSGFGSGLHCMEVQDWFSLKNRDSGQLIPGQIQLAFKYSPVLVAA